MIAGAWRALRAEWLRLRRRRAALVLPPVAAVAGAGYSWALGMAVEAEVMGARSGLYLAAAASSGAALTCAVVGALAGAGGVGGDLGSGLGRTVLSQPIDRGGWLAGRVLALGAAMSVLFLCACLGALGAGWLRFGAGRLVEDGQVIAAPGFLARQLAAAVALSLLAQLAAVAVGAALGALVRRASGATVATALAGAALAALARWPRAEPWLPLGTVTAGLDRVAQLAQGIAASHAGDGALRAVLVCLVWTALALAGGALALSRRDIST